MMMDKAVFLDRDGTINLERNYLIRFEDWEFINGAVDAIKGFHELGFLVIVVTNQAGIAKGFYESCDVERLHKRVNMLLAEQGCSIDAFYFCPHHPDISGRCDCRKPAPGMILRAADDLGISLKESYMIGDKLIDVIAAADAGVMPILVKTGYGIQEAPALRVFEGDSEINIADDIFSAYLYIKNEVQQKHREGK